MDQLQLTDFLRYRFLAQPKFAPDGQRAAFTVTNCNEEENCYETVSYTHLTLPTIA